MSNPKTLKVLYGMGLLLATSIAFPAYIKSSFLEDFVDLKWIGIFFIGVAFLALITINFFPYYIKKFSNYRLAIIILLIHMAAILLLITTHSAFGIFILFVIIETTAYLMLINMDVFVERFTANPTTGRIRTVYFTFINLGWLLSPLAVGYLVGEENYRLIYLIALSFLAVMLIIMLANRKSLEDHLQYEHRRSWETLKNILNNSNLRGIFGIAFLLELFYAVAVIYVPIYLHQTIGFDWKTIGIIFTFMLLPFVFLEIPAGKLADKYAGEKKILNVGFLILIVSVTLFFLTKSINPLLWGVILFTSRCGAALVESMRESYFFKIVDVKEIDYINFFRNVSPLAYLTASGLGILILKFFPVQILFFFLALILLSGFYFTGSLKKIVIKRKRGKSR
ncbi:MAG: hypothetical protein COY66_03215 [Candidatus Kerfeldbacteria bacterium CG_4_10_14_0_8_um_filter_42_10]|uniref:Major facilitator superfamily (MFS) profile domain-containing protein n=1 Tax=Candidatus Kerfeldbacteria bacterium CG_4_10_14_0_8_um_filter_42_10 TaxID=2014248 RepID=A0A2M7RIZ0_9BACT|nr:MAG: hypothetical protein COY66_03215 [Candidatus Kerfeldbacteria bacterium CG_4_10_14_0_8_um_filter_42_10]